MNAAAQVQDLARMQAAGDAQMIPAPQPLPDELAPVDPFPLGALPDAFRPWVADVADRMQCPADFVAVPMLVGAASLVARRVAIRPKVLDDWKGRGNLWAMLVGRPGFMKSPAMLQALEPLERLEARAAAAFNAEAAQYRARALADELRADEGKKAARASLKRNQSADVSHLLADPEGEAEPVRPRYIVNDLTYEKLGVVLSENPDGVLSVRDEMRGLLLHLAREEQAPARAFYLQAWSGGRYTFDRIGRGTITVADARLSIVGCIQPGPLSDLVRQVRRGAADDGMLDRFLIAWPDSPGEWRNVDRIADSPAKRAAWSVFDRLDALDATALPATADTDPDGQAHGLPYLRFSEAGREAFGDWREDFERSIRAADSEGLEGALSKFRHHVPALALALHVIDGGAGPVSLTATLRALALAEYFESHLRRLHGSGRRGAVKAARALLLKAQAGALPDPFTARDVYRNQWAGLADRETASEALDMLAAHGWLNEATADTGGRPTTIYSLSEGARRG